MNDTILSEQADALAEKLRAEGYVADAALIASLHLMRLLDKPLLIEGEAGVGKTDIARTLARAEGRELIRLQCYEGLDAHHALYDWDYRRQLLAIQMQAAGQQTATLRTDDAPGDALNVDREQHSADSAAAAGSDVYSERYLLQRPLLRALMSPSPVVLLIDEVDRADEEFEALLLEILSDFQVSIPELGTVTARTRPQVILTSNGVRDLSDALRRRCLYHYADYPSPARELAIVRARLPGIELRLARQLVDFVQNLRRHALRKTPGIAEALDWAAVLMAMQVDDITDAEAVIDASLACLLKTREDIEWYRNGREQSLG